MTEDAGTVAARWDTADVDVDAYHALLGMRPELPSLAALDRLTSAHVRTVPFENVDVLLGAHPGTGLRAVADKLVTRRRGGYCFEHVVLVGAVLERLGYPVRRHLSRMDPEGPGYRTHATLVVSVDGADYLADVGFGSAMLHPMPLREGVEVDQAGWPHRLVRVNGRWTVQKRADDGWQPMHSVDGDEAWPSDFTIGHHYVSTHPHSPFTGNLVVFRTEEGRVRRLLGHTLRTEYPDGRVHERPVAAEDVESVLDELGVLLGDGEAAALRAWQAGRR